MDDPNSHLTTKLKRLVAASVPALDYDNVTIIGERARFSDFPLGITPGIEEEKHFVSIWSVIVAKESVTRFRIIFFTFTVLLLLLTIALMWLAWKIYPYLKEHGGLKSLFHLHAPSDVSTEKKEAEKTEKPAEAKEPSKEEADKEKSLADKDVDQT